MVNFNFEKKYELKVIVCIYNVKGEQLKYKMLVRNVNFVIGIFFVFCNIYKIEFLYMWV